MKNYRHMSSLALLIALALGKPHGRLMNAGNGQVFANWLSPEPCSCSTYAKRQRDQKRQRKGGK